MKIIFPSLLFLLCMLATACAIAPGPTTAPVTQLPNRIPPTFTPTSGIQPPRPSPTPSTTPSTTPIPTSIQDPDSLLTIMIDDPSLAITTVSPDGSLVGLINGDTVEVWSVRTRSLVGQIYPHDGATGMLFSPDGTSFITFNLFKQGSPWGSGNFDNIYVWSISNGAISPEPVLLRNRSWFTTVVCYSPDSRKVLVGSTYGEVYIWDIQSGVALSTLKLHIDFVESMAMAPDGDLYASEAIPVDENTLVSKLSDPSWRLTLQKEYKGDGKVFFSPDGSRLAIWSEYGTTLLNTTTWGIDSFLLNIFAEGFTPDGVGLLVYDEDETRVVSVQDHSITATYPVAPAIFLSDGRVVGMVIEGRNLVLRLFER